ncbi:unnamed protein product [marine sediment metagenome]|uniref:Uncharacterized protein n=1 Tax=marine sediment metagenome TaxID=412755 RepID=X1L412_9ZZZZ
MKWKVEAGVPADYWFARTLDWIYKVRIREDMVLPQPAVVRVKFEVTTAVSLTREDARLSLQSFLDTASAYYNLHVLYACYDPFGGTVLLDIQLYEDEAIFETVGFAAGLVSQCLGAAYVYWDNMCDFAWLDYFEVTAITIGYEVPIAYISEEAKFPIFVLAGLGMLGLALLVTQPWKQGDFKK